MPKIRISQEKQRSATGDFSATLSFDNDEFEGLTVRNPLSPQNKAKLEWHFEQYVGYPYMNEVKPEEAEKIIREAGENLFSQLFSQPDIYFRYREAVGEGLNNLVIEISGSPDFHSLQWELLKDPNFPKPLVLDALVLRKDWQAQKLSAVVRAASTINLLVVTSRPRGRNDVGYRTISRPLVDLLRNSNVPVKVHILRPPTYESLDKHLDEVGTGFYHAVHFDVHGALLTFEDFEGIETERTGKKKVEKEKINTDLIFRADSFERYGRPNKLEAFTGKDAFLFFDYYREPESKDDDGFRADAVRANELADLLITHGVPLVILNACQSAKELGEQEQTGALPIAKETSLASRLMKSGAQMVLAMAYSVTVTAAEILMKSLYQEIFRGKSLHQAIQSGRRELAGRKQRRAAFNYQVTLEDWLLPVVYQKQNIELRTQKLSGQEEEDLLRWRDEIGRMPEVEYGFHGRDIDVLNLERRVLLKNNVLLIRGMGGAGKTTLLRHLAWWWRATDFIKKVFYFGYDNKAYTRQQILIEIAQNLYDRFELANFQAMDERLQQQKLALQLRNERHLLILDNLESIQGGYFAVKNTLSEEEQAKLKEFLAELRGTDDVFHEQTIVLLGSRSAEAWLADKTFGKNLYELNGLDKESATQFAEEILRQNGLLQYRGEEDFKKLLKLLGGFPLPVKVIFENLKSQTPSQILQALKAGDVNLNIGDTEEKTANILKCIEYSHSNIAPEKQELLLCLAPFTSVINPRYFKFYVEELMKHDALSHLRQELWTEVFTESIERGLISLRQEEVSIYQLQPILPYFLKTEWQKAERTDFKQAVQAAFRDYYDRVSDTILNLMDSKKPDEKTFGQFLASLEFENIDTCLEYSLNAQTSIRNSFFSLAVYYDRIQNHQAGLDLATKVFKRMESLPPEILSGAIGVDFVSVLDDIARRYLSLKNFAAAEEYYQKVLSLFHTVQSLDDNQKKRGSANIYQQLGMVAWERGELEKAEQYTQQSLDLSIESGDRNAQARNFHLLGIIAAAQDDRVKQERNYQKALQIFDETGELYSKARVYSDLATLATNQEELTKAAEYYQKAREITIEVNEPHYLASIYKKLGKLKMKTGELPEAENFLKRALQIYVEFNDYFNQADTFVRFGEFKLKQEDFINAQSYFLKALEIFKNFDDDQNKFRTIYQLEKLWKKSGDDGVLLKVGEVLSASEAEVRELFEENRTPAQEEEQQKK